MDNFTFRGRDIAEFGAVAAFGESMRTGAKIQRSEYEMPGGGSVEIGEAAYRSTQRTVTITPADGMSATPAWRRSILSWLQGGRGALVEHGDPEVYRIAQFDTDGSYDWRTWPQGMLQLQMTLQPYAYAQRMTRASGATQDGECALGLRMETGIPAPLTIDIEAAGGTLTGLEIECGGETLALSGLSIPEGGVLSYTAGEADGSGAAVTEDGLLTFEHVTRWALLKARGAAQIRVHTEGCEANITARARCRYPA